MRRLLLIVGLIALAVAIGFTVLPLFFRSGPVVEVFPLDPEVLALSAPATPLSGVPTLPSSASATASPIPVHASIPSVAFVQQGLDGYEGCVDTYIQFYLPDENFCGGHELSVGSNNKAAVLLRFDLTELPETAYGLNSEAIVQQATLSLYGVQGTRDTAISTYVARREWEACAITWNQPWQEPGADGELDRDAESWQEVVSPRMPGWLEFDVTELVRSWLREPASNLGLMIKSFDARWPSQHIFFASDHPATTSRPKLTIEYQPVRATRTPVSPTVTPTAEQIPEPSAVVTPDQPLSPRVVEVRWSEQMAVGDPHEVTVVFRPATTSESATGSLPSHVLSVAAHLTAPSFDIVGDSPTRQAMEDAAGSLSWSWSVTPRMAGSQLLSLDLLFTWQPMVGASTEVRAEPGMWYLTRTIEVGTPPADSTLETVRNVLAAVGLVCMIGFYVLRWRDLGA